MVRGRCIYFQLSNIPIPLFEEPLKFIGTFEIRDDWSYVCVTSSGKVAL